MKIQTKPIEPIFIELKNKTYKCTFNMLSMAYMQELLAKEDGRIDEISPAKMASFILYAGIKPNHEDFEYEDAVALVMVMGPANYSTIVSEYNKSMFDSMEETDKQLSKKILAQYIAKM